MQALLWKLGQIGLVFVSTRLRCGCLRGNIGTVDARRLQALCQGFLRLFRLFQTRQNGFKRLRNGIFVIGIHAISGKLR